MEAQNTQFLPPFPVASTQSGSPTHAKLYAALAKAQGGMKGVTRDKENTFFKTKYADLASVIDASRAELSKNGLCLIQFAETSEDGSMAIVRTRLAHESGEWLESRIVMKPTKPDPQGIGSAQTYARRYGWQAIVGIAAEDDDDSARASKPENPAPAQRSTPARAVGTPGKDAFRKAAAKWSGVKPEDLRAACAEIAKRNNLVLADITDESCAMLANYCESNMKQGVTWAEFTRGIPDR